MPPYRRNVNTVFQDYALFPHLSVLDNVAYGLMIKGVDKADAARRRPRRCWRSSSSPATATASPAQLSGGQRQRVALARALVNKPKVLLLDEPLGALDLKLREQMQEELKALQQPLGITFVFVTHDQGEALSMADRVAVFNEGRIVQVGTPEDIYERPRDALRRRFRRLVQRAAARFRPPALDGPAPLGEPAAGGDRRSVGAPRRRGRIDGTVRRRAATMGAVNRVDRRDRRGPSCIALVPAGAAAARCRALPVAHRLWPPTRCT